MYRESYSPYKACLIPEIRAMPTKKKKSPARPRKKTPRKRAAAPKSATTWSATTISGISNDAVKKATGRTWAQWLGILDDAGARDMPHKQIAQLLHDTLSVGDWWAQMVTVGYEQSRGLRDKHQRPDGYSISGSKTIAVSLPRLYNAWNNAAQRSKWLGTRITIRKATANKSMRITWCDGKTNVEANFYAKGSSKAMVSVQHNKLADAAEAAKMKAWWATKLESLKTNLEG